MPVPPWAIPSVPVMPGRGDACRTLAAVVEPRFVSIEGDAVRPVPPLAMPSVPVMPGRGEACRTLAAVVLPRFVSIEGDAVRPVPPDAMGNAFASSNVPSHLRAAALERAELDVPLPTMRA